MRNLRNIRFSAWKSPSFLTAACWDPATDDIVCTSGPSRESSEIELFRISATADGTTQHRKIASWDAPSPSPDNPVERILNMHHFGDTLTTCIALEGGDIYIIREDAAYDDEAHIEIVGTIDSGIAAARWSPDEELLAIATKDDTVVFMSRSFDGVAETTMTVEDLKTSKHVSVGWGKKETQFRGKGAKAQRDPTIPEKVDEGVLSPQDEGRTTISWRGDGAYVAINSIEAGKRRVIRVYSREGELDGVSEPVDGLEGSLSWRPEGNLMAGIQRLPDRKDVVFFERNGLRHGQFTLRLPRQDSPQLATICPRLEWNSDSTVLAVIYPDSFQLWTMGNYHWYLKQEIQTKWTETFQWHPEKPLHMVVAGSDSLSLFEFVFSVARGSTRPGSDHGAVAVVDGKTLKITAFSTANVPPPMALFELDIPGPIRDVVFAPDNKHFAVLYNKGFNFYQWNTNGKRSILPKLLESTTFEKIPETKNSPAFQILQISIIPDKNILLAAATWEGWKLIHYTSCDSYAEGHVARTPVETAQLMIGVGENTIQSYTQLHQTAPFQDWVVNSNSGLLPLDSSSGFKPWMEIGSSNVIVGLARNGALSVGGKTLAKNCTSFVLTPSHTIFTTNNHLVKFVHWIHGTGQTDYDVPLDDPEKDERCRSIERGARIITAMPSNMSIVLQMPRGNLETIFPRAMVLAGIRRAIGEKDYKSAFSYCRTHRVDMNILYDHKPEQFLKNVDLFLYQLGDATAVDLFLSSLREEDVTEMMYKDTTPQAIQSETTPSVEDPSPKSTHKVNAICDAVLKALEPRRSSTNLQNIITANVSKLPPALDDGLQVVAQLMKEDESLAESAAEHICFLVDVNRLYDHALGLYNLQLTLLIAQQSQRDPREYVPFVQSLHALPETRRKFTIDDRLSRRDKALNHLHTLDVFEELRSYVVKHNLYQLALKLYRYDLPRHSDLVFLYAQHLEATSKYREAGLAYESLSNFHKASSCYRAAGPSSWRECLYTAQQTQQQPPSQPPQSNISNNADTENPPPMTPEAFTDLATTLSEALTNSKDHTSAAEIHLHYLSSPETAIKSLSRGYNFSPALQTISRLHRPDLLPVFDASLTEALGSSTEFLADCRSQLSAQVPRILELRERAAADPLAFYEGELPGGGDIPDDVSVAASSRASTSASLFTRYTGKTPGGGSVGTLGTGVSRATAKNRKREEKKRARGRKGTVYEEEYLVNSVRRLIERVEGTGRSEVERLVEALVRRGMGERARAVEGVLGVVVEGCNRAVREVWGGAGAAGGGEGEVGQDGLMLGGGEDGEWRRGGEAVLAEMLEERKKRQVPPVIMKFEGLSLLG